MQKKWSYIYHVGNYKKPKFWFLDTHACPCNSNWSSRRVRRTCRLPSRTQIRMLVGGQNWGGKCKAVLGFIPTHRSNETEMLHGGTGTSSGRPTREGRDARECDMHMMRDGYQSADRKGSTIWARKRWRLGHEVLQAAESNLGIAMLPGVHPARQAQRERTAGGWTTTLV